MKTTHTQGIWRIGKQDSKMYSIHGTNPAPVAMINPFNSIEIDDEEIEANANLIASAPELLVICKEAQIMLERGQADEITRSAMARRLRDIIENANPTR